MGRPRKLSSRDNRAVKHLLINGEAKTAVDIKKAQSRKRGQNIITIGSQCFGRAGIESYEKKTKIPRLTQAHLKARFD